MTEAQIIETRVITIEVGGNRVVYVTRFTDPTTGRDVLSLSEGWRDDGPMPGPTGATLELPGAVTSELIAALEELEGEA